MAVTREPSVVARQFTPHIEAHIVVHVIHHLKMFGDSTYREIIGQFVTKTFGGDCAVSTVVLFSGSTIDRLRYDVYNSKE